MIVITLSNKNGDAYIDISMNTNLNNIKDTILKIYDDSNKREDIHNEEE